MPDGHEPKPRPRREPPTLPQPGISPTSIPRPDSPELAADLDRAEAGGDGLRRRAYAGKLADLPGGTLAAAIAQYERIEEILGRVMSYAQLAVRRQFQRRRRSAVSTSR